MGNIWDSISDWVFWHTQPAKTPEDGNERDTGKIEKNYALQTNAFTGNVFHNITAKYGSFKSSGMWHQTFEECREVLEEVKSIAYDLGVVADKPVMKNPANKDFSLTEDSPAIDQGVKCFVPWPLYATVGEWNFYPAGDDPTRIMDEHWYMTPYYYVRDNYYKLPMFPLTGINITKDNYVDGPLEDWTKGACTFNGENQYAVCPNSKLNQTLTIPIRFRWDKARQKEDRTVTGRDFKSPQIWDSNFCIEAYFKTESKDCVLVQKMAESGYGLTIDKSGQLLFTVKAQDTVSELRSKEKINDGKWHHVIAEADRSAKKLTIYIDDVRDSSGPGIGSISINNNSDLLVCGTPNGKCLKGTVEFIRISLGTLKDAKTNIEELYAWQFDGPFLRDFTGSKPKGKRDAGALELLD
jgi:VCBS repeat-containing protein